MSPRFEDPYVTEEVGPDRYQVSKTLNDGQTIPCGSIEKRNSGWVALEEDGTVIHDAFRTRHEAFVAVRKKTELATSASRRVAK